MLENPDSITLDPSPIFGTYPIPASRADIAIGLAVQGGYHKTEWSDHVKNMAQTQFSLPPIYAYKFTLYLDMAERIYADIVSNKSVLGLYTEKARHWRTEKAAKKYISPPSFTELLHIWWKMAADRTQDAFRHEYRDTSVVQMAGATSTGQYYAKPLLILNSIVEKLITECTSLQSVTDRCECRLNLYTSIFKDVLDCVKFWPADRNDPFLLSNDFREDMEKEDKDQNAIKATLLSFADEIEDNLKGKKVDFTAQVKSIVANFGEVARVEGNDLVMPSKNVIDKALLYKLKTVLQSIAQRNISYSRGLDSGKIDRTRLFRAPTTGSIFSLKKVTYELFNDIVLLVDCTGSMADPVKWSKISIIYQTLFMAIVSYNSNARIFAYNERSDTCRITEIYKHGEFFSVIPHGRTASGEAIIATSLSLKSSRRKPFIIHITDGATNWGCGVSDAIRHCAKKKIRLLTLGLECDPMNTDALRKEYGEYIQFVNSIEQLPNVLNKLLSPR
ncbi:MAG: VWA domain-containing protein [Desulfuromonadaceae bacterium]|nr:VWA domain-containing protein [Desulfuromonadaceae bacterium]